MKVFVISLPKSHDRRASASALLGAAGVDFSFFDGLPGDVAPEAYFERYDEREYLINCGRPPTKGEIGCYASHRALWQQCVDSNEPIVIMEDDFTLAGQFARALGLAKEIIHEYGFLRFQLERRAKKRLVKEYGEFSVYQYTKVPHSMMCYVLHPRVAARLLERSRVLDAPVDVMVKKNWEYGCRLYGLTPYVVWDNECGYASTIGGREKYSKPLLLDIQRALRKIGWLWSAYKFNCSAQGGERPCRRRGFFS